MNTRACSAAIALTAIVAGWLFADNAKADTCETYPGSQVYTDKGCDKAGQAPAAKPVTKSKSGDNSYKLSNELKKKLDAKHAESNRQDQADRISDRITDANRRARAAIADGGATADAGERGKQRRAYDKALRDLRGAYDDAAKALPNSRQEIEQSRNAALEDLKLSAAQTGSFETIAPEQARAAPVATPDPNVFTTCTEPDRRGEQTCYQVPRNGLACVKQLVKGGDALWSDRQVTCEDADILRRRNAYFKRPGRPLPDFGDADREREAAVGELSAKCRKQLNDFLAGSDRNDGEKATLAYATLRSECEAGLRQLAKSTTASLPERRLSSRARSALDQAMGKKPDEVIGAIVDGRKQEAAYDIAEVIGFGVALADILNGVPGIYSRPNPVAAAPALPRAPQGKSSPIPVAPRSRPSDITGTK